MNAALKQGCAVPEPRDRVFAGSLSHLRRPLGNRIDLLSTQFSSAGGSFVVGVASRGPTCDQLSLAMPRLVDGDGARWSCGLGGRPA
jgi:hypothetical protein